MNLAAGKTNLSACPYVTEEAKAKLAEAEKSPIRIVTIGAGDNSLKVGGNRVMFRHERRFENPPGFAIRMIDTMDDSEIDARLIRFKELRYQRIGFHLRPELIAIQCDSGEEQKYASLVSKVKQNSDGAMILISNNPDILAAGLEVCHEEKPLIYAATSDNVERVADLAGRYSCTVAAKAFSLEELAELTTRLMERKVHDIVLDSGSRDLRRLFDNEILIRRAAIYDNYQPLCFPTIVFPCEMTDDPMMEALTASIFVAKYGDIIVLSDFRGETLFPLLLQRFDIYSDPQQPRMAPEGIYEIGQPHEDSPVIVTSSWALTYLNLSASIEASGVSAFLCVERIEETDVMCWCRYCLRSTHRGKLNSEKTADFIRNSGIEKKVKHRKLIIPARTAQFQSDIEKALPEWKIIVGPAEAALIESFLPNFAKELQHPSETRTS
jgi:acetyl-CoA decarbonylase/synthase complex subunit gamma